MRSRWGRSELVEKARAGQRKSGRRLVQTVIALAVSVVVLSIPAGATSAAVPATLSGNAKAIAELTYRNWFPNYSAEVVANPRCHVVCRRLWDAEQALSPSSPTTQEILRELLLLTKRTGTSNGFWFYPHNLVANGTDHYVGGWLGPGSSYGPNFTTSLGVKIPEAFGSGSPAIRSTIVPPGRHVMSMGGSGGESASIDAPTWSWQVDEATWVEVKDARCGIIDPSEKPQPGPEFVHLQAQAFCYHYNQSAQEWETLWGGVKLHAWLAPVEFDRAPRLGGVVASRYDETTTGWADSDPSNPGLAHVTAEVLDEFDNHAGDYPSLMNWLDGLLGGSGNLPIEAPELYGDHNPAEPNVVRAPCADPVDCATGNFTETYSDTAVSGPGFNLTLERSYNSLAAASATSPGPLGYGWTSSFRSSLEFPSGSTDVIVHQDNGSQARFYVDAAGEYESTARVQATLTALSGGGFEFALPDRSKFTFNVSGQLTSESDANGNTTTMAYTSGQMTSVTDPAGRSLTFTYNSNGTVATVTDPASHTVNYTYAGGELVTVTDVGGKDTDFAYDSHHRLTQITDPRGNNVTTNVYDAQHRVTSQKDALNHETTWSYVGGQTTVTHPNGAVTRQTFVGNLPTEVITAYGTAAAATSTIEYDDDGNPIRVTDANGHVWKSSYDALGSKLTETDPLNRVTAYAYDPNRQIVGVTKPGGGRIDLAYDYVGNLRQAAQRIVEENRNSMHYYGHRSNGLLSYVADDTRVWEFAYDAYGNRTSETTPLGHTRRATYDLNGRQLTTTTARGKVTTIVRNAYGSPTTVTDPYGKTTTYAYDDNQNVTDITDRDGNHTTISYDALDRPIEVHRADGSVTKTAYTATGEVASRTDGLNQDTDYGYDLMRRLTSVTDPLGRVEHFTYDPTGNRLTEKDPDNRTTTLTYDNANQLTGTSYSADATRNATFSYNADGQRTGMVDASGTSSWTYDSIGRLTSSTNGADQETTYHWDIGNRLTSIDYPDALTTASPQAHVTTGTVTRTWNNDDEMTSVTDWLGNTTSLSYDADGSLTSIERPNGVDATYTYDDNSNLGGVTDGTPATTLGRSDAGLLSTTTTSSTSTIYLYDAAKRLSSAAGLSFGYDNGDNLTQTRSTAGASITQSFDVAHQLTSTQAAGFPLADYTFNNEGQRTAVDAATGPDTTLSWSQGGTLLRYQGPDRVAGGSATADERYVYDADGLRQSIENGSATTSHAYDVSDALPLMITDADNAYIYGPDGLPLEQIGPTGTVRYFSHDQLGSTTQLTNSSGATVQSYTYDARGQRTSSTPTVANPFQYAGQYTDATTGLQYLRARYHDPTTSQFLSPDPLQDTTGQPYSYANNDPINNTDPTGQFSVSAWAAGTLDGLSGGYSTKFAGSIFGFNADCADFGSGFGTGRTVGLVGSLIGARGAATVVSRGIRSVRGAAKGGSAVERGAASVVGRRGSPIEIQRGTNAPGEIGGRPYSGHALDRMQGRGIPSNAVEDAIANGESVAGRSGTTIHYGPENNVSVVVGRNGRVVTVGYGRFKP
jgi:RHS repeat-associated protein